MKLNRLFIKVYLSFERSNLPRLRGYRWKKRNNNRGSVKNWDDNYDWLEIIKFLFVAYSLFRFDYRYNNRITQEISARFSEHWHCNESNFAFDKFNNWIVFPRSLHCHENSKLLPSVSLSCSKPWARYR